MSGAKRKSGYRKTVQDDTLNGAPEPGPHESLAVVGECVGANLFKVTTPAGSTGLAMLPTKFRSLVWVKRGDAVIVGTGGGQFETAGGGQGAVQYVISSVLYGPQVAHLKRAGLWPDGWLAPVGGGAPAEQGVVAGAGREAGGAGEGAGGDAGADGGDAGGNDGGEGSGGGGDSDSDSSGGGMMSKGAARNKNLSRPRDLPPEYDEYG